MKPITKKWATLFMALCFVFCGFAVALSAPQAYAETATVTDYLSVTVDVTAIDGEGFILYATAEDKSYGWCEEPTNGLFARFVKSGETYTLYFKLKTETASAGSEAWGHGITVKAEAGEITLSLSKNEDGTAQILINGENFFTTHFSASKFDSIKDANGKTYVSIVNGGSTNAAVKSVATEVAPEVPVMPENAVAVEGFFEVQVDVSAINGEGFIVYATAENKNYGWCEEPANGLFARFVKNGDTYLLYFKLKTETASAGSEAWGHGITVTAEAGTVTLSVSKNENGTANILINGTNFFTDHFSASVFDSVKDESGYTYFTIVNGSGTTAALSYYGNEAAPSEPSEPEMPENAVAVTDFFEVQVDVSAINGEGFIVYATAEDKSYGWCEEPANGLFARFVKNGDTYLLYFKLRTNSASASSEAWGHGITVTAEAGTVTLSVSKNENGTANILINGENFFTDHFSASVFDSVKDESGYTYFTIVNGGGTTAALSYYGNEAAPSEPSEPTEPEMPENAVAVEDFFEVQVDVSAINNEGFIVYATAENKTYGWCEEPTNGLFARFVKNGDTYLLYFKLRTETASAGSEAWGHGITVTAEAGTVTLSVSKNENGTANILINGENFFTDHFSASVFDSVKDESGYTYFTIVNGGGTTAALSYYGNEAAPSEPSEPTEPEMPENGAEVEDYLEITVDVTAIDGEGFILYATAENKSYGWCEEPTNGLYARFVKNGDTYLLYFKLKTETASAGSEAWGHGITVKAEAGEVVLTLSKNENGTANILINGENFFTNHFSASVFDSIKDEYGYTYLSTVNGGATAATVKSFTTEPAPDTPDVPIKPENAIVATEVASVVVDVNAIDGEGFIVYVTAENKEYGWCEEPTNGLYARFVKNGDTYLLYFKLKTNSGSAGSEAWGHGIELPADAGEVYLTLIKQEDGTAQILINGVNYFTNHFSASVFDSIKDEYGYAYVSIVTGGGTEATVASISNQRPYIPNSTENWSDVVEETEEYVVLASGAYYKKGLKLEDGHIQVNLSIETLTSGSARMGFAFMSLPNKVYGASYQFEQTITATGFIMWFTRAANNTLVVNMLNVETGRFDFMALGDSSNYSATGMFKIDLYRKGDNNLSLFFNDVEFTKSSINDVHYEDLVDSNGYTYFSYDSYSEGESPINNTVIKVYGVYDSFINIEVPDFSKVAIAGREMRIPKGKVDDSSDYVSAKVLFGETEIAVENWRFTPAEVGNYTIVYCYDNNGVTSERRIAISVVDGEKSFANENLWNKDNWVVGGGSASSDADGVTISGKLGYQYYNAPLLMDNGYIGVDFEIKAITNNSEYDQWIMVALVTGGTFTSPAGFAADGLYFWFTNHSGYLMINAAYKTAIGVDYLMQDVTTLTAVGKHTIGVMVNGEGVRLFVDTVEITGQAVNRMYASDIVNSNNCTYLAITEYSADGTPADAQITINSITYVNDRDLNAPVINRSSVATEATVGDEIAVNATAEDEEDGEVLVTISVIDPLGEAISVVNGKFVAEVAGDYVIIFTAVDNAGNTAEDRMQITVSEASENKVSCAGSVGSALMLLVGAALLFATKKNSK